MEILCEEFEFYDSVDLGNGRHRQTIKYCGNEIGYLIMKEYNWLVPIEEIYILPDIDYGLEKPIDPNGLLEGKLGWIDFKRFKTYEDAFEYANQHYDELIYLFKNGDFD